MPATVTLKLSIPRTNLVIEALRSYEDEQREQSTMATDPRTKFQAREKVGQIADTLADLEAQG